MRRRSCGSNSLRRQGSIHGPAKTRKLEVANGRATVDAYVHFVRDRQIAFRDLELRGSFQVH